MENEYPPPDLREAATEAEKWLRSSWFMSDSDNAVSTALADKLAAALASQPASDLKGIVEKLKAEADALGATVGVDGYPEGRQSAFAEVLAALASPPVEGRDNPKPGDIKERNDSR